VKCEIASDPLGEGFRRRGEDRLAFVVEEAGVRREHARGGDGEQAVEEDAGSSICRCAESASMSFAISAMGSVQRMGPAPPPTGE